MPISSQPLPYTDEVETIPTDEADDIQRVVQAIQMILARGMAKSGEFRAELYYRLNVVRIDLVEPARDHIG